MFYTEKMALHKPDRLISRKERVPAIKKRPPHECGWRAYRDGFTAAFQLRVSFLFVSVVINAVLIIIGVLINSPVFAGSPIKLSTDKNAYFSGEKITVNFNTTSKLEKDAWIGFFKADTPFESTTEFIEYQYIYKDKNNANKPGGAKFKVPADMGHYEIRVISSEQGKVLTTTPVKVIKISPADISLGILTKKIKPAQPLDVKITSTFSMNKQAWIGIFPADISRDTAAGYTSYSYINNKKGDTLRMSAPEKTGDYELRVYAADPGALIKQLGFRLGELDLNGIKFSLNKKKYDPEEDITIKYTGHPDLSDRAWLGLFKSTVDNNANQNIYAEYIHFQYLKPRTGGKLTFKAPSTKGEYQIRLFYNDYGPELLSAEVFSVTSSIDEAYLKKNIVEKGRVTLYGIYFDTDKSRIKPASLPLIKQIAEVLKSNPEFKIRIEGHSDSQGDSDYNQTLSEKRAAAVKTQLISSHAIPEAQLKSKGYGESKPVNSNDNAAGRAKNRRVELVRF